MWPTCEISFDGVDSLSGTLHHLNSGANHVQARVGGNTFRPERVHACGGQCVVSLCGARMLPICVLVSPQAGRWGQGKTTLPTLWPQPLFVCVVQTIKNHHPRWGGGRHEDKAAWNRKMVYG